LIKVMLSAMSNVAPVMTPGKRPCQLVLTIPQRSGPHTELSRQPKRPRHGCHKGNSMSNPWLKSNPFMSMWLSGAKSVAGCARGRISAEAKRQSTEVERLAHAWSCGAANQHFSDRKDPDASRMAWAFTAKQFSRRA
jgi:hypothetical protein